MAPLTTTIKTLTATYEQPLGLYIDGKWTESVSGNTFQTINPNDESVIASVHQAGPEDVDIAVKAARKAFKGVWAKTTPSDRGLLLLKLADLFQEHKETLAGIDSLDNGKALPLALGDVEMSIATLRYYGGWADKLHGKTIDTDDKTLNYTRHEPLGVCGQIIPWNFPIQMWSWKIGPALATGNTVVLKTAEQTPLSGLYAAELCHRAGFPPGVINVLSGYGSTVGAAMAEHTGIDKVAFTGSTLTGRSILKAAANSNLKKVTLELGGKSPNIVFDDADLEQAVSWVHWGIFYNQGQCCCAGARIYVQSGIYDRFVRAFTARTMADDGKALNGPLVSQQQYDRVMAYIESGKAEGAKLEYGGVRRGTRGYSIEPTVFSSVGRNMSIMREEIFGPVASIARFDTEEEVIELSNDSNYGLAAGVHTRDLNTALRVSNAIGAGTVWVNSYNMLNAQVPFGGYRESGFGRELGKYALANYMNVKSVRVRLAGIEQDALYR